MPFDEPLMDETMSDKLRILFVHQNSPGQFKLLVGALAAKGQHEIVCLGDANNSRIRQQPTGLSIFGYRARQPQAS